MEIKAEWKAMFAAHIAELDKLRGMKKAGQMPKFKEWQYHLDWESPLTEEQKLAYQWYLHGEDACQECAGTGYVPPFVAAGQSICPVCNAGLDFKPVDRVASLREQSDIPKIYRQYDFESWYGLNAELAQGKESAVIVAHQIAEKRGEFFSLKDLGIKEVGDGALRNGLFLYGIKGVGKTALACTVGNLFIQQNLSVAFVLVAEFLSRLKGTNAKGYEGPSAWQLMEQLKSARLLILDELHIGAATDYDVDRMVEIIRRRYHEGLPTIITTNTNVDKLGAIWSGQVMEVIEQTCHSFEMKGVKLRKMNKTIREVRIG